ncbi:MAG: MATE family efflux transporter [Oligoflexales bacterium]|nr:MATE family efflux transporter [Oligoflexales bacterium]
MEKSRISTNRQIFKIAIPSALGFLGMVLFETINIFWIGKLGSSAVAGVAAAAFILWTAFSMMRLTTTGCASLVAQNHGAGNQDRVYEVIRGAFFLSLITAFVIMAILYFSIDLIFTSMGVDAATRKLASEYFIIYIIFFPVSYLFVLQENVFNGYGKTKPSTIILLVTLLMNMILDPLMIFGLLGFPELGIRGAAFATISCEFVGILLRTGYLLRKKFIAPLSYFLKFSTSHFSDLLRIGFPSALTNMVWSMVFPMLTVIITKFGMEPLAGLNIGNRFEGIPYFTAMGFSVAIGSLIGQSLGRGEREEINRILTRGVILITIILMPISLAFIFLPSELIGLLNSDPKVIYHGAKYLRIVGYLEIFLGWELVIEGGFNGLANTRPYMNIRIPLTFIRIPLAYFLAFHLRMGIEGVWWAVSISTFLKGTTLLLAFKTNRTNRKIIGSCGDLSKS